MESGSTQSGVIARSFIEDARRAQIVQSALEVIAERGYARATMGRIAQRAGNSRRLVNHHFAGRADLIGQLIAEIVTLFHRATRAPGERS